MEYIKSALELVFPTKNLCFICKENETIIEDYMCKSCYGKIEIVDREVFLDEDYIKTCHYTSIYNTFMKEIIKSFKFNDKSYLYRPLGALLLATIHEKDIGGQVDLISFVPSHRRKEAIRGYNQSELLASFLAKKLDIPVFNGLVKIKKTPDQHFLNEEDRRSNLKGAFSLKRREEIEGKRVLLIDDILTSGSTMEACAKELIKNEAKTVHALALTSSRKI